MHVVIETAPTMAEAVPSGHTLHVLEPATDAYDPAAQGAQVLDDENVEKEPTGHWGGGGGGAVR